MSYRELHAQRQLLPLYVSRNDIKSIVENLTTRKAEIRESGLDTTCVRGFFIEATNENNPFRHQLAGKDLIVVARSMNRCWKRMVIFKELMHLFDSPMEAVSSSEEFEDLISSFLASQPSASAQRLSEDIAFWRALCLFCPERERIELQQKRKQGLMTDKEIAIALRLPEEYVELLFNPSYRKTMALLIK